MGLRFARYAAGLRAVVEALWLSAYAAITAVVVNLVVPATSQGSELVDSLSDSGSPLRATVTLLASAVYCAAACATSSALVIRYGRLRKTARPAVLRARRAVPYWLAAAVLASCSALFLPLPLLATVVPFALVVTIFALPLAGRAVVPRAVPPRTIDAGAVGLVIAGAAVCVAIVLSPVGASRALGAWPIVYLATGFWTIVGSVVFVVVPKRLGLPALTLLPLVAFAAFSATNDNHRVRVGGTAANPPAALDARFDAWARAACVPSPQPCPVYLVAAQGGGSRAAYWTTSILDALDRRSNGRFGRHVFAISAVSGGALGAAAYVAAKADARGSGDETAMRAFLGDDYLSPIVGAMMFPDFIARFVPTPLPKFDRAAAFESALEHSWRAAFSTDRFAQDVNALYAGPHGSELPSLLLNATNVESGKRFVVSNLSFAEAERGDAYYADDPAAAYRIGSLALSTAVHLGARFPFISPHGVLEDGHVAGEPDSPWGRLVDGGYYDNSGTATLSDLLDALERYVTPARVRATGIVPEFVVVVISSDVDASPSGEDDRAFAARRLPRMPPSRMMHVYRAVEGEPAQSLALGELNSPIEALLAARGAHADAEMRHLAERVEALGNDVSLHCRMARMQARSAACMPMPAFVEYSYARALASVDFTGLMNAMSHGRANHHALVQLVKPGLGWTLSSRSRHALDELSVLAVERQGQ